LIRFEIATRRFGAEKNFQSSFR